MKQYKSNDKQAIGLSGQSTIKVWTLQNIALLGPSLSPRVNVVNLISFSIVNLGLRLFCDISRIENTVIPRGEKWLIFSFGHFSRKEIVITNAQPIRDKN